MENNKWMAELVVRYIKRKEEIKIKESKKRYKYEEIEIKVLKEFLEDDRQYILTRYGFDIEELL